MISNSCNSAIMVRYYKDFDHEKPTAKVNEGQLLGRKKNVPTDAMADSGLETGSMVSIRGTISANSSENPDEPSDANNLCGTAPYTHHRDLTKECAPVRDEIAEYENRVLSEPFDQSNGESDNDDDDDDDQGDIIAPASSVSLYFGSRQENGPREEGPLKKDIAQNGKDVDARIGLQPSPPKRQVNASTVNNYYFIDASSLNDDIDVSATNIVGYPNEDNTRLSWSSPQMPTNCYASSPKFSSIYLNDDPVKLSSRVSISAQNRYEVAAATGFERNYCKQQASSEKEASVEPSSEPSEAEVNHKKESLVVEIKETDSGESAQHSPCPDNSSKQLEAEDARLQEQQQQQQQQQQGEEEGEAGSRRASLIRRNTFELEANDEKLSSLRQEYERRQGSLVFQNSITQYSQHRIDIDGSGDDDDFELLLATSGGGGVARPFDKYKLDASEKETKEQQAFSSLPISINELELVGQLKSRIRRNEAAPIISGGSSSSDFGKPAAAAADSPMVKRKTESTPILSGGSVLPLTRSPEEPANNPHPKSRSAGAGSGSSSSSSAMAAWVVDMSDCQQQPRSKDEQQKASSIDRDRDRQQPSSLGYFVNLDDIDIKAPTERAAKPSPLEASHRRRPSDACSARSCEFFVDLSDQSSANGKSEISTSSSSSGGGKKNMFSMFIDLRDDEALSEARNKQVAKSSSSSKLAEKRQELAQKLTDSSESCSQQQQQQQQQQQKRASGGKSGGVFMFIESDSPIVRRRTLSSSRPSSAAFKRHSWNTDKSSQEQLAAPPNSSSSSEQQSISIQPSKRLHKRAQSLSVDRNATQDFRKMLAHKSSFTSTSSHSLNEVLLVNKVDSLQQQQRDSPKDDSSFDYDMRDTPPNSHVEIINEELLVSLKNRNYQELDAINEQTPREHAESKSNKPARPDCGSNCASENSLLWEKTPPTDSTTTETQRTRKSETFDISTSTTDPSSSSISDNIEFKLPDLLDVTQNKLTKQLQVSQEANNKATPATPSSFVKLSDLDKKPASSSTNSGTPASTSRETPYRMSISVTETSWIENRLIMTNRSAADFHRPYQVKKLPLSIPKCSTKPDNFEDFGGAVEAADVEAVISESDISSLQSSMGRSGQGSTAEETETSTSFALGKPYNRLGEDLLRMFLDEINPDVTIDVAGRRIRAHKCILSSRCQYFAAILSGGWIESAGNVISLQGYSYNSVHFALCHIYSGESCIPDSISIVELATLADMLCLEGLKEVIGFTLKVKYCHLFHKPCKGCSVGVLECMPLAAAYGLDEVYRKSLRWVTRHFVRIWPTKEFATLPRELMDKCYHQHIVHMSTDNVLQTIMDCDKLLTTLPNVRWAEPVFRLVSNLLDASMKCLTDNFASVLGNEGFQVLDRELTWNVSRLEDHLLAAAERLPPEQACKSYSKLDRIFTLAQFDDSQRANSPAKAPLFMDLMEKIRAQVEKCLVRDAARAARTNAWLKMDLELRRRIQEMACLVILPNEPSKRPSRHSNFMKEPKDRQDNNNKAPSPASRLAAANRNLDLRRVKMAISEHNDRTLKQAPPPPPLLQTRKVMNKPKTDPLERKLQSDKLLSANDVITSSVLRPKSWPNKTEVKSRYLEPRIRPNVKDTAAANQSQQQQQQQQQQQRKKILISSSDSSRTSSPAMKRAAERKALTKVPVMKKDGKTLSSDSINSNCESASRLGLARNKQRESTSKSCGMTRAESPSLKAPAKNAETGLSIDSSLADPKKKALIKAAAAKLDTSTDSLATDTTAMMTTPKSTAAPNKSSQPILDKAMSNLSASQRKKSSPLAQQRNLANSGGGQRRPARSIESSTAASRSRAAATVSTYSGSLNLRKSLLDAAKAPDIPSKTTTNPTLHTGQITRSTLRQSTQQSIRSSFSLKDKLEKKSSSDDSNHKPIFQSGSPASKRSPRLTNANSRMSKSNVVTGQQKKPNKIEDKLSNKIKSQQAAAPGADRDRDGPKFLNQSSRSGTFLKDEPTILNKSDIETAAIDV